jgi:hypothetical protein
MNRCTDEVQDRDEYKLQRPSCLNTFLLDCNVTYCIYKFSISVKMCLSSYCVYVALAKFIFNNFALKIQQPFTSQVDICQNP